MYVRFPPVKSERNAQIFRA